MTFFALLKDSLVEALDRKSLYFMLAVALLFILSCASISYTPMDEREALQDSVNAFSHLATPGSFSSREYPVTFTVSEIQRITDGAEQDGRYEGVVSVQPVAEFHQLIRDWQELHRRPPGAGMKAPPDSNQEPGQELQERFIRARFGEQLITNMKVARIEATDKEVRFKIGIRVSNRHALHGAYQMHIGFGLKSFRLPVSLAVYVFGVEYLLSEWMAGLIGVLIGLVITAGSVPSMLQKGALDVLLSKPVHRISLLSFKYLGGLLYAGITSLFFIGGSWLAISARSGIWNWGYLATFGTLMLFFAVLYSLSVLTAVVTRSTIAAISVPVVAWALGSGVNFAKAKAAQSAAFLQLPGWVETALESVSYLLPRAGDINKMNNYFMMKGSFGEGVEEMMAGSGLPEVAWLTTLLSSAGFIVVMMSLACWRFCRQER